jgi:RND family efflux transporter MFP subunit
MKKVNYFFVLFVLVLGACQNHENEEHENESVHDHSEEAVSFQYTSYQSGLEIFVETEALVTGKSSGILTHVTKLNNFKPLLEGKITASLVVGQEPIRQTLEKPIREGIYLFNLEPKTAGKGKLHFEIETADSTFSVSVEGVEVFADEHDAIHEAEEAATENSNAITFTKEQSWKIDFATEMPVVQPFGKVIKTTAHIQPAQGEEVILTAKTNGVVSFSNNSLTEGTDVVAGNSLLNLSGAQLADNNMQVRFNEAKINFETARANYNRMAKLAEDNIVSQKELLDAKNTFDNARLVYENLQQNFSETGEVIKSPESGFVKQLYVTNGQYVEAGSPLVSISRNKTLFLKAEIQQKHAAELAFIKTATVRSLNNSVYTLEELNGKVVSFGKSVSDENYLVPFTLQIENRHGFLPGSFVDVFLKAQSSSEALTVPNSALIEEQENFSVLVQLTPEQFEKREIKAGKTDGIRTEILSGLAPHERIITRGSVLVKLAGDSNTLDPHAGHVH